MLDKQNVFAALKRIVTFQPNQEATNAVVNEQNSMASLRPNLHVEEEHLGTTSGATTETSTPVMSAAPSTVNLLGQSHQKPVLSETTRLLPEGTNIAEEQPRDWKGILKSTLKIPALLLLLYLFICSLDFLSTSFRLIAGKTAGSVFQSNTLLSNPVVGLMIGIFFTVLVQSSSTCTSVIVSMVSSDILDVRTAIPMVMGANVGTSLTSTLVSLTQVTDRVQFERAFAGATVHDCFNWLTVISLLLLETTVGYLYHLSMWLTQSAGKAQTHESLVSSDVISDGNHTESTVAKATSINILGTLTKPFTKRIVQIDKSVLKCWGLGGCQDERLLKIWCTQPTQDEPGEKCGFLLNIPQLSDQIVGIILIITSLTLLSGCLIMIVKLLRSALEGTVADLIQKTLNADLPGVPWLTGYLAILAGAILTFVVQSSSVFTATLTPLVGVGLISVDRVYPLTLGSNLGTTTTAVLAALAAEGHQRLRNALQIAMCHFLFNLTGILLFYPVPAMRWPLTMCRILGRTTAKYRWFAVFYLLFMFFILPGTILLLSLAGGIVFGSVMGPVAILLLLAITINVVQSNRPDKLPGWLQNWDFLPLWMHSLEPMDNLLRTVTCGFYCCSQLDACDEELETFSQGAVNLAAEP